MSINNYIRLCLSFLVAFIPAINWGQESSFRKSEKLQLDVLEEKIVLTTDRTLYVVEENIQFKAVYLTDRDPGSIIWSTVLYVELITPDGTSAIQSKFPLSFKGTSGSIQLPNDLHSGIYYLKAYTKWMRNYSSNNYGYYQIKLINPYDSTLLSTNKNTNGKRITYAKNKPADNSIEITLNKLKYGKREKVDVNLVLNSITSQYSTYAVAVVRKEAKKLATIYTGWSNQETSQNQSARYYPEINGISLSGKVVNPSNDEPVTNAKVSLSLLNTQSFFSEMMTNSDGGFFFTFPFSENAHDFYINAEKGEMNLEINIDQDFCQKPVNVDRADFKLSDEEEALATEMAVNAQVTNKYKEFLEIIDTISANQAQLCFYGSPNKVFFTKDYIDLPNIEEFLFELVPEVTVSYQKNIPSIHTSKRNAYQNLPFLILIDNIPISDVRTFLNIKPNAIKTIELIDNSYVIGDSKYNGVIHAFSKNQNIAGIDLPKNSLFFNYHTYSPSKTCKDYRLINSRTPDRRNCLYWNPDLDLSNTNTTSFSFYTSDIQGDYEIIVHCISKINGEVTFSVAPLLVE